MADPTAADLLTPAGPFEAVVHWPHLKAAETGKRLDGFLLKAKKEPRIVAVTDADANRSLVVQWGIYLGWSDVYNRLTTDPSTVEARNQGSSSILVTQIENVKELRDEALADFEDLLTEATGTEAVETQRSGTYSTPISFRF